MANLRYQLDEHMHHAVARRLRQIGIAVVTTHDTGLIGASDMDQLAHAHANGHVMVTQDTDFLELHYSGAEHSGILFSPRDSRSIGELIEMLVLIDATFSAEEMVGRLEYI